MFFFYSEKDLNDKAKLAAKSGSLLKHSFCRAESSLKPIPYTRSSEKDEPPREGEESLGEGVRYGVWEITLPQ